MKKAQLQTLEPILIVIVLVMIAGIGLLFYVQFAEVDSADAVRSYESREALALLQRITTLPELSCGMAETAGTYCIDEKKAWAFGQIMQNQRMALEYQPIFGFSNITLFWIDAGSAGEVHKVKLYSQMNSTRYQIARTYFTVYDPVGDIRKFAMVEIAREVS